MSAPRERIQAPIRFFLLGGLSFSMSLGITAALHEWCGASPEVAFALALVTVFLTNFAAMRWWVFAGTRRSVASQFVGFGLASLFFRGLEYCGYLVLYRIAGLPYLIAAVAAIGTSFVLKYVFYDSWLFSRGDA